MYINKEQLVSYIKKLSEPRVLVIGDLAIDEMIYGDAERISREAPVLILRHSNTKLILGAASNAAHNVSTLNDGKVSVIGVCGDDFQANQLRETFEDANVNCGLLVVDPSRKTTTKTRISGSITTSITQQIVRIDRQTNALLSPEIEEEVLKQIERAVPEHDAIILSNYHIGTLTPKIIQETIRLANQYNKVIVVDAQKDLEIYKKLNPTINPNYDEFNVKNFVKLLLPFNDKKFKTLIIPTKEKLEKILREIDSKKFDKDFKEYERIFNLLNK